MSSNFTLKLMDRLSAPARAMAAALSTLLASERAVTAASVTAGAAVAAAGAATAAAGAKAASGAAGFDKAAAAMKRMKGAAAGARGAGSVGGGLGGGLPGGPPKRFDSMGMAIAPSASEARASALAALHSSTEQFGPVLNRSAQNLGIMDRLSVATNGWGTALKGIPYGMILSGLGSIAETLYDIGKAIASTLLTVGKLTLALGALAAFGFTVLAVKMAAFAEGAKRALGFITGSNALGVREFGEAARLSERLGTNLEETVAHYSKLRSMQFSAIEATGLVKLSTDLKAITGDSQAAERALTAMTQIKAKGKLQSEELVGQLAEAGVSTVLVYKELEKLLGTDRKGVLKQLQGGNIDSETGLVAVVRALKQKYHVQNVGTIGAQFAETTIAGMWESLKNAPARMFMRIGEQIDTTPIILGLKALKRALDGAFSGGSGVRFVNAMVAGIGKLIPMAIAFAEGFGAGLDGIARALSFGEAGNVTQWARDAGLGVAKFFERVIEVTKVVVPQIVRAIGSLLEGLDINSILADLKAFDWKAFGDGLVTIAGALGSITKALGGGTARAAAESVSFAIDPAKAFERKYGEGGLGWGDMWSDAFKGGVFGPGDAEPAAQRIEPRISADALRAGMTNHIKNEIRVEGDAANPDAHAAIHKAAEQGTMSALRKFLDLDAAQAIG